VGCVALAITTLVASALATLALGLAGCASGETNTEGDATPPMDTRVGVDESSADTAAPDTRPSEDTSPDETSLPDGFLVCTPDSATCLSDSRLELCKPDGSGYEEVDCAANETCVDGACTPPEMVCTPNETRCADFETVGTCSSDGTEEMTQMCAGGRCIDAACSSGASTGASCAADSECAGQHCKCATGCAGTPLSGGYCTTGNCDVHGCAPNEICVDFSLADSSALPACVHDCST